MCGEDLEGWDPDEFWEPRIRAAIESTEELAEEIHEEVQELRKELKRLAATFEEPLKQLLNGKTNSGD